MFFFFKQKTAYEMRISDWSSDVCSSDLLPELLAPGDLLVFNDTRVIPARLFGHKDTGGRVEILIERILDAREAKAQLGFSKAPKPGSRIVLDAGGDRKSTRLNSSH